MYLPRSRGGTISPRVAIAPTIRPPAPSPCSARNEISIAIDVDRPDSADPIRKSTIAKMKSFLRPYMSPSLP